MATRIDRRWLGWLIVVSCSSTALAQSTVRVDLDATGRLSHADACRISGDGRWLLLEMADDWGYRIVARDRIDAAFELVSVDSAGVPGDQLSVLQAVSPTARHVLMLSDASNFTSPPPITRQAYVRDRTARTTTLVSCGPSGLPADGWVECADMSDDGRFVVFDTEGTNLGVVDPNGPSPDVFLRDVVAGTTLLVSATAGGTTGNGLSSYPAISGDGRWIAFLSRASDIVGPGSPLGDVLVFDRIGGTTTRILAPGGAPFDDLTYQLSLSFDGRWLAFTSSASNLVGGDAHDTYDVFTFDRNSASFTLLSRAGSSFANDHSGGARISRDGARVLFQSRASDLVPGDVNGASDLFVTELATGAITRLSVSSTGYDGDPAWAEWQGVTNVSSLSDDGRFATFVSDLSGLVAGDDDPFYDPFLRDRFSPCAPVTAYCTPKVNSSGCSPRILSAGDPYATGPDCFFVCALDVLDSRSGALLWSLSPAATPFAGGLACVAPPLHRTPLENSGSLPAWSGCGGRYGFHFSQAYLALHGCQAGTTIHAQFWSRDPGFAAPDNFGLTAGLSFTLGP